MPFHVGRRMGEPRFPRSEARPRLVSDKTRRGDASRIERLDPDSPGPFLPPEEYRERFGPGGRIAVQSDPLPAVSTNADHAIRLRLG